MITIVEKRFQLISWFHSLIRLLFWCVTGILSGSSTPVTPIAVGCWCWSHLQPIFTLPPWLLCLRTCSSCWVTSCCSGFTCSAPTNWSPPCSSYHPCSKGGPNQAAQRREVPASNVLHGLHGLPDSLLLIWKQVSSSSSWSLPVYHQSSIMKIWLRGIPSSSFNLKIVEILLVKSVMLIDNALLFWLFGWGSSAAV